MKGTGRTADVHAFETMGDLVVMRTYHYQDAALRPEASVAELAPSAEWVPGPRYCDQPMDWRTRLAGLGGTAAVGLLIVLCLFFTWRVVQPVIAPSTPLTVIDLQGLEAPPEPVREVPDGPEQVLQEEQKPSEQEQADPPPEIILPRLSPLTQPVAPPVEQTAAADPVPETTAPKSIAAPPANRMSSNAEATWEALLLAHLEEYRRYPARARAARQEGVVHVRFRMNRAGAVLSASILRSSGFSTLDRAALDTLKRAQPLPAIPDDRPDEVELTIPVEYFVRR
ncbi:MAG: TonB family protein [Tsuneonella suprasediminis]